MICWHRFDTIPRAFVRWMKYWIFHQYFPIGFFLVTIFTKLDNRVCFMLICVCSKSNYSIEFHRNWWNRRVCVHEKSAAKCERYLMLQMESEKVLEATISDNITALSPREAFWIKTFSASPTCSCETSFGCLMGWKPISQTCAQFARNIIKAKPNIYGLSLSCLRCLSRDLEE